MTLRWDTALPVIGLGLLVLAGCEKNEAATPEAPAAEPPAAMQPASGEAHAAAGVEPGSYEDWCGAHQVPESLCTRCNPSLIAAFKATGDWCEEHGLPESQCLRCNPDLRIERPPRPAGTP